uniref:Odorant receptor n=1 Tax=Dendrolimus kikuchii TaxID=765133 RepID=A0A076E626_9NEOP|nr:odorant receptor [Dendrolimus kikuchii]
MWETLRKFGLEYCDLPTMIWNVSVMLRVVTLNIDQRNKKPIPVIFYIIMVVGSCCYIYVYQFSMCWLVFIRCKETGDLLLALIVFSLGVSSEMGPVKLLYIFINRKEFIQIVTTLLSFDTLVTEGSRYSRNLLKTLRYVKKRAIIFWLVLIINGLVYILKAILLPGRHLMEDNFILYGLEPIYETPNYQIAFIIMGIAASYAVYLPANITAFLIVIMGCIEAQLLALSEELINLWSDAQHHYILNTDFDNEEPGIAGNDAVDKQKEEIINDYINKRLKEMIKKHSKLITLLKEVELVLRGAIAVEFGLLIVALIAELLGGLENTYLEVPFALMQVGMDCFIGQRIIDASEFLCNAIYDCKWENFDKYNMKTVLLMLQNAQKTLTLSAGGITVLSFGYFMTVIKSIYSTYTTLRTTMK